VQWCKMTLAANDPIFAGPRGWRKCPSGPFDQQRGGVRRMPVRAFRRTTLCHNSFNWIYIATENFLWAASKACVVIFITDYWFVCQSMLTQKATESDSFVTTYAEPPAYSHRLRPIGRGFWVRLLSSFAERKPFAKRRLVQHHHVAFLR